jgi:cytidylate kinase
MAIITISRGSYSKGKEVAEKVAQRLGYRCIARDVLLDASKEFNIPEIKLIRSIHDAPNILNRFTRGKEKYIAFFRSALLKQFLSDNVVFHGLAGHFFVKDVGHALKIRIIADMEDRVRLEMQRHKVTRDEALRVLKSDDEQRRNWSLSLYGIDTSDPSLYDLVIHIAEITVDIAADIICRTAGMDRFRTTPESHRLLEDLALCAEIKAMLINFNLDADVRVDNGYVRIGAKVPLDEQQVLTAEMKKMITSMPGVNGIHVDLHLKNLPPVY